MSLIIHIIVIVIISAIAGAAVSLPLSILSGDDPLRGVFSGMGAGAAIGFAARFAFSWIYIRFRKHPLPAFTAMAGTVGAGTAVGCLLLDVRMLPAGIILTAASVLVSIGLTALIFRYSMKLNSMLQQKQKEIEKPGFSDPEGIN